MSTVTPNFGLNIPENTDTMDDFFDDYEENMNIIDESMGGGGGSANLDELTEADYDALPDTKYSDNVLYLLKDAISADAPDVITLATCYSTSEREVGCWTDGKPLYQKTVHISALPSSAGSQQYPHNIANIDKICHYESVGMASTGSSVTLNRVGMGGSTLNGAISYDLYINKTNIIISVGQDRSGIEADITIWYTKTTDSAGSGDWTPDGTPTVHYDNTEKVIGTWFGETLYEKTFAIPNTSVINSSFTYAHGISNLNMAIVKNAFMYHPATHTTFDMPIAANDTNTNLAVRVNATNIFFTGTNSFSADNTRTLYITLQYTKTS